MPRERREKGPSWLTIEEVARAAKETALKHGQHAPTVLVEGSLRSLITQIVPLPENHDEKMRQMFMTGFEMAVRGGVGELRQAFLISEGWLSSAEGNKSFGGPPSQDPNRKEVLIVFARLLPPSGTKAVVWEMVRSMTGRLIELRDFPQHDEGSFESPLLDAFIGGFLFGRRRSN